MGKVDVRIDEQQGAVPPGDDSKCIGNLGAFCRWEVFVAQLDSDAARRSGNQQSFDCFGKAQALCYSMAVGDRIDAEGNRAMRPLGHAGHSPAKRTTPSIGELAVA